MAGIIDRINKAAHINEILVGMADILVARK
jgi:hypothetical protein